MCRTWCRTTYIMALSKFGCKLNPCRSLREPLGVKGVRQYVVITNNPSSIDQNQQLLVRFPNLGKEEVIVPGTARLAFTITLASEDANRTVVQKLVLAIVKMLTIKISGNEVMSIDDSDVFHCYNDLWKTAPERANGHYQGIDASDNRNTLRIRVSARNGDSSVTADKAIADAFGDRFFTPLDFKLLESHMPLYQSALGDRLEYELTFNDYSRVIQATGDVDASYHIGGISLEYDMITLPELARMIDNQYKGRLAILCDRVLRHWKMTVANLTPSGHQSNVPVHSMKGILILFENVAAQQPFARNTEAFYNPYNESGCHHRGDPQPTLQSRDARLSDVGHGKEVLCGIARQKASPRSRNGRKRPDPGRRQSGRILDQQVLTVD